jgi:microcystin-dependent protein
MDPFIGEIRLFAGTYAPVQWSFCDGSKITVSQNQALFSLLTTIYGGDGSTYFNVPDLRGRLPIHQGQGTGLTARLLGQNGGSESIVLGVSDTPAHNHTLYGSSEIGTAASPAGAVLGSLGAGAMYADNVSTAKKETMSSSMISYDGASLPHDNMMPCMAINYIIALQGIYPVA